MSDLLSPLGDVKLTYTGSANRISSFGVQNFGRLSNKVPLEIKPFTFLTGDSLSRRSSFLYALRLLKKFIRKREKTSLAYSDLGSDQFFRYACKDHIDEHDGIVMNMVLERSPLKVQGKDYEFRHLLYDFPEKLELSLKFQKDPENNAGGVFLKSWEIKDPASGFHLSCEFIDGSDIEGVKNLNLDFGRFNKKNPDPRATTFEKNFHHCFTNAAEEQLNKIQQVYAHYRSYPTYGPFLLECPRKRTLSCYEFYDFKENVTAEVNKIMGDGDYKEIIFGHEQTPLNIWNSSKYLDLIITPFYHYITACLEQSADCIRSVRPDMISYAESKDRPKAVLRVYDIADDIGYFPKEEHFNSLLARFGFELEIDAREFEHIPAAAKQLINIFSCLVTSNEFDMLLIEDPEDYLDAAMQTQLAEVLAEEREGRKYVIQTKSEFLVSRFKALAESGKISMDDIAVYDNPGL